MVSEKEKGLQGVKMSCNGERKCPVMGTAEHAHK